MTNKKLWAAALLLSGAASGTVAAETTIHAFAPLSEVAFTAPKDNVGRYVSQRPSPADRLFQSDIIEKKIAEIFRAHRFGKIIALHFFAAERKQHIRLRFRFHAFGNHGHAEI